jgi:hypothetical protein
MDLIAIVGMFALSLALGLCGTGAIFVPMFSVMTRARASHDAAKTGIRPEGLHTRAARGSISASAA